MKYKGKGTELMPTNNPKAEGLFEQAASIELVYFDLHANNIGVELVLKK